MSDKNGISLLEVIVVLIIIGFCLALAFPNYTASTESAKALTARNNLLAIYSAEQNNNNNNNSYCAHGSALPCDSLADINTALSLSVLNDGTYNYDCPTGRNTCTATRTLASSQPLFTVTLNSAIDINGRTNPTCASAANPSWCP